MPKPIWRRPVKTFSAFIGASDEVRALQALLRQKAPTSFAIAGPPGCGRFSLAQLSASTLVCHSEDKPCGRCVECMDVQLGRHPDVQVTRGRGASRAAIELVFGRLERVSAFGNVKIEIIEDADQLEAELAERLSSLVRRPPEGCVIVLTARELRRLPTALQSLCPAFELPLPRPEERLLLLRRACMDEGFDYEDEALREISLRAPGNFRGALLDLEKISRQGSITNEAARRVYYNGSEASALNYLCALLSNRPLDKQLLALRQTAPRAASLHAIKTVLNAIFEIEIGGAELDRALQDSSICLREQFVEVLELWRVKSRVGLPRSLLWEALLDASSFEEGLSNAELNRRGLELHNLLNVLTVEGRGSAVRQLSRPRRAQGEGNTGNVDTRSGVHLDKGVVQEVTEAASYMVLEYGVTFNVQLIINFGGSGIADVMRVSELTTSLLRELRQSLDRRHGSRRFHFIRIFEADGENGMRANIAMHIPEPDATRAWLRRFFGRAKWRIDEERGWAFRCRKGSSARRRHVAIMKLLCGGLDPTIMVEVKEGAFRIGRRTLLSFFGIPRCARREVGTLPARIKRYACSEHLASKARSSDALAPLSLFEEQRFGDVLTLWELALHDVRASLKSNLEKELAAIDQSMSDRTISARKGLQRRQMILSKAQSEYERLLNEATDV